MPDEIKGFLLGLLVGGLFSGLIMGVLAEASTRSAEHAKAIEAGVGYWQQVDGGPMTEFVYGVKPESAR